MKHLKFAFSIIVALLVASCASLSQDSDIQSASRQTLPQIPAMWTVAQANVGDVQIGWIDRLGDPGLTKLVREAKNNNRDLQSAAANVERSWALSRQAGVGLKPNIGLSTGANRQVFLDGPAPDSAAFEWGVQAGWEADIWGRIRAGEKAAIASAESTEADYRYAQHSIAAAVAKAYFIGVEASLQADVAQNTLVTLSETDRIVNVQYENGLAMAQDVALSASDLASTRASLISAQGAYRNAIRALEVLIGRYPNGSVDLPNVLPVVPPTPPAGTPSDILARRPDIVAAERQVAAAFYSLDQAEVANMPSISLVGNTGSSSSQLLDIIDPKNILWRLASSLSMPLYDGGLNKAQIEQATTEQKLALASYAQTALTAFQEVESGLDQNGVLRNQTEALQQSADQANRALNISRIRYNEGESDLIDVLTIQQRVFSADSNVVSAKRARLDAWIDLNLALGGNWE